MATVSEDVAIVGAGIVGLAHAWSAAERGHRVTLFERSTRACGASIRNFGIIWPIGQPAGKLHELARQSRDRWLRLAKSAGIWVNPCGSIHLAHHDDERAVLQEFCQLTAGQGVDCAWLSAEEVLSMTPAANPDRLLGGLFSPATMTVNPRLAIGQLSDWLAKKHGIVCEFGTTITSVDGGRLRSADGQAWTADRIVICSGADFETLFPDVFSASRLRKCKLQMLQTGQQENGWRCGPVLASGLTLRHYPPFEVCPSLAALKQRIRQEKPELDRFGIHVMAAQNQSGDVILGDSHEYDFAIEPFHKAVIDELILRELRQTIQLPNWSITQRWSGIYASHPTDTWFDAEPMEDVHICTGLGGAGMTMSFGIAEQFWQHVTPRL